MENGQALADEIIRIAHLDCGPDLPEYISPVTRCNVSVTREQGALIMRLFLLLQDRNARVSESATKRLRPLQFPGDAIRWLLDRMLEWEPAEVRKPKKTAANK